MAHAEDHAACLGVSAWPGSRPAAGVHPRMASTLVPLERARVGRRNRQQQPPGDHAAMAADREADTSQVGPEQRPGLAMVLGAPSNALQICSGIELAESSAGLGEQMSGVLAAVLG